MFGFKRKGKSQEKVVANVRVGKPQVKPTASAHTAGVKRGNARGNSEKEAGIKTAPDRLSAKATARRSTGINAEARNPIDPRMPNLPPA
ncbi:MAG TPA: hypothetical protein VIQ54_01870 [Polyangia bacterium]|jgi:hypothetical protein